MKRTRRLTIAIVLCGLAMAWSATCALGQSPTADGYDETGTSMIPPLHAAGSGPGSPPDTAADSPGDPGSAGRERLPFTGFELPALALLGGALISAGGLIRWRLGSQAA